MPPTKAKAVKPRRAITISPRVVMSDEAPRIDRHELSRPALPPGVYGRGKTGMALDDAAWGGSNGFGYLNAAAPFGLYFPGYPYLAELSQLSEYRAPTEAIARLMTRRWIEFGSKGTGDKAEKIKQIHDDFENFGLQDIFRVALEKDGYFGRAQIFIDIKGMDAFQDKPLRLDSSGVPKGSLRNFKVIEPMWTTPIVWNSNRPKRPDFYKPTRWMVLGEPTDSSRLMTIVSREVPDLLKPAYNFGGLSLSQLIQPYVNRWLETVSSVNRLISTFSIVNFKSDMGQVLEGGDDSNIIRRAQLFTKTRNNQGVFLTDKEREDLDILNVTLAGLAELQAQAQEHMAAPTKLPLVYLTGITPDGLNASSQDEIEVCHEWIHSGQEATCTAHVRRALDVVQLSRFGSIDPDITFTWRGLKEETGEAAARIRKDAGAAGVAYITAGVIDAQEERQRIANDPTSGYNNLDLSKEITPPDDLTGDDDGDDKGSDSDND